jgi:lysophospholipase L1-like esterase
MGAGGAAAVVDSRVLYDAFSGGGAITAHTPDIAPVGSAWAIKSGAFANLSGGAVQAGDGNNWSAAIINGGIADADILCNLYAVNAGQRTSLMFRSSSDGTNRLQVYVYPNDGGNGTLQLMKVTSLTSSSNVTGGGYSGTEIVSGDHSVFAYINGNIVRIGYDGRVYTEATTADYATNTYYGIGNYVGSANSKWYDLTVSTPLPWQKISVIGDSISTPTGYVKYVSFWYKLGRINTANHQVGGTTIMADMAGQVTSALSDAADYVIVEMGTNDADNANITATYQAQLARLLAVYPANRIFCMGILPRALATDNGGVNNPRIATACANVGVTFWDTRTDPWINTTTDLDGGGLHPSDAGYKKIAERVVPLLP